MNKEQVKNALRYALLSDAAYNDDSIFGVEICGSIDHGDAEHKKVEDALEQFAESFIHYYKKIGIV